MVTQVAQFILDNHPEPGYAVDVGANNGLFLSNTIALEKAGWNVLCIEANPLYGPFLWANRKNVVIAACGEKQDNAPFYIYETQNGYASYSGLNPHGGPPVKYEIPTIVRPLTWFLAAAHFPQLDVLCVDVEGGEPAVVASLDFALWQPHIVVVENWENNDAFAPLLPDYKRVEKYDYDEIWVRKGDSHG